MSRKTIEVVVCDLCGGDAEGKPHSVYVDRWAVSLDACAECWTEVSETLDRIRSAGTTIPRSERV
jgi:ribosome-binding protein aMBF1 (putative translation factor)